MLESSHGTEKATPKNSGDTLTRENWVLTQSRLRAWQKSSGSGWELRRILSQSEYFPILARGAHARAKSEASWQDWWAFVLQELPERAACQLLLDAWNKDVWSHINQGALREAWGIVESMGGNPLRSVLIFGERWRAP